MSELSDFRCGPCGDCGKYHMGPCGDHRRAVATLPDSATTAVARAFLPFAVMLAKNDNDPIASQLPDDAIICMLSGNTTGIGSVTIGDLRRLNAACKQLVEQQ